MSRFPTKELQRAVRQLEAQFVYSSEGMTNQAYWLGLWEIVDGWQRASSLPDEIRSVTADDVRAWRSDTFFRSGEPSAGSNRTPAK